MSVREYFAKEKRNEGKEKKKKKMAYKQRWEEYFKVLDADKSGFIDPADAALGGKVFPFSFFFLFYLFFYYFSKGK